VPTCRKKKQAFVQKSFWVRLLLTLRKIFFPFRVDRLGISQVVAIAMQAIGVSGWWKDVMMS